MKKHTIVEKMRNTKNPPNTVFYRLNDEKIKKYYDILPDDFVFSIKESSKLSRLAKKTIIELIRNSFRDFGIRINWIPFISLVAYFDNVFHVDEFVINRNGTSITLTLETKHGLHSRLNYLLTEFENDKGLIGINTDFESKTLKLIFAKDYDDRNIRKYLSEEVLNVDS